LKSPSHKNNIVQRSASVLTMMRSSCLLTLVLAQTATSASVVATQKLRQSGDSFVSTLKFKTTVRICNAYPYKKGMEILLGKEKITTSPLEYKLCDEFHPNLKEGDKLDFQVDGTTAGTFSVSALPQNDAILVLIIHRHDPHTTAVSFESHVFSNLKNAQIAVIDTYKGPARSLIKIQDQKQKKPIRNEELRFDSVVAVSQGAYHVTLENMTGATQAKHDLVAVNGESYVLIRVGVEGDVGPKYPQDIVVYPESLLTQLGGAKAYSMFVAALATLLSLVTSL